MERPAWNNAQYSRHKEEDYGERIDSSDEDIPYYRPRTEPGLGSYHRTSQSDCIDDYMDDMEYSSPSPPERRSLTRHHILHPFSQQDAYSESPPMLQPQPSCHYGIDTSRYHTRMAFDRYSHPPTSYAPLQMLEATPSFQPRGPRSAFDTGSSHRNAATARHILPVTSDITHNVPETMQLRRFSPRNENLLRLKPVSELPDMYRSIFKFGVFNAVQSTCLDTILHSDENVIISAPTGSGKTVLFELAIIRMVSASFPTAKTARCVYVAPTKALCTEKYQEWVNKFGGLGIKCSELTGDTVHFGKSAWGDAKNAQIIVTTGEKWDSLTRNWDEQSRILSQIQLFLVDEVHILNESRGSTLEVVVSRMKARGSGVRFVLVSATVPNIEDVASWIGSLKSDCQPAKIYQFGEEFRPCKLSRFVYGVLKPKNQNDFVFAHVLDSRLFSILQKHSSNKPALIFVPTRKGTMVTAKHLAKAYEDAVKCKQPLPWSTPTHIDQDFHDKDIRLLAAAGIGVHHAGLNFEDRRLIEDMFMKKTLRVVVATSTLAVGVNLRKSPVYTQKIDNSNRFSAAYVVIIKGVKVYQNGEVKEYSDLDVMQMMGRAGRPQFDTEGVAVILCEAELEHKYRALVQGTTNLESSLHLNLTEHLNSEIGLGTIANIYDKLRLHDDIRFPIKKVQKTSDKIFLLIQAVLGGIPLSGSDFRGGDSQPHYEAFAVFRHISRIATGITPFIENMDHTWLLTVSLNIWIAIVEVAIVKKNGAQAKHGLELVRCLHAKAWEDRPVVLRQIEHIGEKSLKVDDPTSSTLNTNLIFIPHRSLLNMELLLNRRAPFGFEILASARQLPKYDIRVTETDITPSNGKEPVEIELSIQCGLISEDAPPTKVKKQKGQIINMTTVLTVTSDLTFIDFRRIMTKALKEPKTFLISAQLTKPSQAISVYVSSDKIAGLTIVQTYKPKLRAHQYPTLDTRPLSSLDMDLAGLEDDPNFWNMVFDDEDVNEETVLVKDLTKPIAKSTQKQKVVMKPKGDMAPEPRKRHDGKYECNHTCRDKLTCRHLCCREGLREPSQMPKKRLQRDAEHSKESDQDLGPSFKRKANHVIKLDDISKVKRNKTSHQSDSALRQLETLHKGAHTERNLKLSEGQRLKLANEVSGDFTQRKSRVTPNFDLEFTTLRRTKSPAARHLLHGDLDDEEELPDISNLLHDAIDTTRQSKTPLSSETGYSDSEIDSLIRNLPLEEEVIEPLNSQGQRTIFWKAGHKREKSVSPRNDHYETQNKSPPIKKPKFDVDGEYRFGSPSGLLDDKVNSGRVDAIRKFIHEHTQKSTSSVSPGKVQRQEQLFLSNFSDQDEDTPRGNTLKSTARGHTDDNFYWDESCFDILPATSSLTATLSTTKDDKSLHTPPSCYTPTLVKQAFVKDRTRLVAGASGGSIDGNIKIRRLSGVTVGSSEPVSKPFMETNTTLATQYPEQDGKTTGCDRDNQVDTELLKYTSRVNQDGKPESIYGDTDNLDDPLAEFERWLMSGAVDIIEN
ncbi:hypothetical protein SERLA73DRAFT_76746 [Serpula lacrymans var. lacrymans S7.3]|uniref:P-loop containing nucleoside triphosphate hydrolase protein n=1 Tax=Serpula lacrymans var. lacrymans (strain S7.3) TaxID=936435 RepID=F8Q7X6_SERL3|nr:hypothetical protein SERLA73DRAFT_76746 [Serpula lacrymans var. lacrymans S7.3]